MHKYLGALKDEGSICHITNPLSSFVSRLALACLPFSINSQNDLVVSKRVNLAIDTCRIPQFKLLDANGPMHYK